MRHQKKMATLDREAAPRRALLANLVESLILYERITTTLAKAKVLRPRVEKLITASKVNTLATRRGLIQVLHTNNVVRKLLDIIGPRYLDRKGGYTRIIKLGVRKGDGSETAVIELV
ncbi:MAG: 50S ribosomal protein L17 [bacterium]|nr:50S ribosomal protein L17 [bacterium]